MLDLETCSFQGGFGTKRGVTRTAPERKKDNHPHEGSVTDLLHPSGTPPLRCRPLHLSSSNWSLVTRRLSLAINTGPSEKIHSQIRRPSFSDSLLTRIRWRSLAQLKNAFRGPNVHFHAPAVFQIRKCFRHSVKIRSGGQTASLLAGSENGARGHTTVCVEAGLYRGCLRVCHSKYSHSTTLTICSGGAKAQRPLRKVQKGRSGAGKPSHSCNPAQYDNIVHIIVGDIFPIPMRKVKGNSGSTTSSAGGRKRVPEGASGPS